MASPARLYVTTPIYYVNAVPHLGTFYSTVVADALARFFRARHGAAQTLFVTGLDEHGQKIERIARDKGIAPQAYCDDIAARFIAAWKRIGISNDDFIRTTSARHKTAVEAMWHRMEKSGDIYQGEYDGLYCVGCEETKTEDDVITENGEKICPIHRRPVERIKERNYFFRLSRYADKLLAFYDAQPDFIRPESRRNEVISFVRGGLRDLSVSRATVKWGLPVPNDPAHTIYVWIDALTNYLTVLGGPDAVAEGRGDRAVFWSASHHLIAKDILRFHAVYWPAMLMAAGLPTPRGIFCHGYLTVKGQKISKSMPATRVDPLAIADALGVDPLRYFVLREYSFGADGDFTYEALFQRHESDLGNDLGNLANRTITLARKHFANGVAPAARSGLATLTASEDLTATAAGARARATAHWEAFAPSRALEETWALIRAANVYIDKCAPWKLSKLGETAALTEVLVHALEAIRVAALMVAPAMPEASAELLRQIGRADDVGSWPSPSADEPTIWPGGTLTEPKPVFPRVDADARDALITQWTSGAEAAAPTKSPAPATPAHAQPTAPVEISIDDFAKIDLRVARVLAAEAVPKTEKLLKLTLDLGGEQRTVVSGIAGSYKPDALVGKTVLYLANLKPAKLRGVVSQGMILAAGDAAGLSLAAFDRDVAPGTQVR